MGVGVDLLRVVVRVGPEYARNLPPCRIGTRKYWSASWRSSQWTCLSGVWLKGGEVGAGLGDGFGVALLFVVFG
jgi:hypothetical protein